MQAVGYEFDNDEYHKFVHGRLPYENLKPDPVLRNLLLRLPLRKLVYSFVYLCICLVFVYIYNISKGMGCVLLLVRFSRTEMKFM